MDIKSAINKAELIIQHQSGLGQINGAFVRITKSTPDFYDDEGEEFYNVKEFGEDGEEVDSYRITKQELEKIVGSKVEESKMNSIQKTIKKRMLVNEANSLLKESEETVDELARVLRKAWSDDRSGSTDKAWMSVAIAAENFYKNLAVGR